MSRRGSRLLVLLLTSVVGAGVMARWAVDAWHERLSGSAAARYAPCVRTARGLVDEASPAAVVASYRGCVGGLIATDVVLATLLAVVPVTVAALLWAWYRRLARRGVVRMPLHGPPWRSPRLARAACWSFVLLAVVPTELLVASELPGAVPALTIQAAALIALLWFQLAAVDDFRDRVRPLWAETFAIGVLLGLLSAGPFDRLGWSGPPWLVAVPALVLVGVLGALFARAVLRAERPPGAVGPALLTLLGVLVGTVVFGPNTLTDVAANAPTTTATLAVALAGCLIGYLGCAVAAARTFLTVRRRAAPRLHLVQGAAPSFHPPGDNPVGLDLLESEMAPAIEERPLTTRHAVAPALAAVALGCAAVVLAAEWAPLVRLAGTPARVPRAAVVAAAATGTPDRPVAAGESCEYALATATTSDDRKRQYVGLTYVAVAAEHSDDPLLRAMGKAQREQLLAQHGRTALATDAQLRHYCALLLTDADS